MQQVPKAGVHINDNKAYGTHANYLFSWKGDALQKAMDSSCMFQACEDENPLKSQGVAAMNKCAVKSSVNENIDGCKLECLLLKLIHVTS